MNKKLVYTNLANGASVEQVAAAFEMSPESVEATFKAVGLHLAGHMVDEGMPFVPCQSIAGARQNRKVLLPILDKIAIDDRPMYRRVQVRHIQVAA